MSTNSELPIQIDLRQLSLRSLIILSTIAIVIVSSQILIQIELQHKSATADIINIAGRQRMLSQRIAKDALARLGQAVLARAQLQARSGRDAIDLGELHSAATIGLPAQAPTIATALKSLGYATGQFGKNHLGDRNEFLPTVHGFDEFFGNLYHLNAEEEPETANWPPEEDFPGFNQRFRPRGVLHCWATDTDDDPRTSATGASAASGSRTRGR
jgi:hypothetical protein